MQRLADNELLRNLTLELNVWERCLLMAFILRKPGRPCRFSGLNLSGPSGALHPPVEF